MIDPNEKIELCFMMRELSISVMEGDVAVTVGADVTTEHILVNYQFTNTIDPLMSWEFTVRKKLTP